MFFLIQYNRPEGKIALLREFTDEQRVAASRARLDLELKLKPMGIDHEVVILEAATESDLVLTHRRYFDSVETIARQSRRDCVSEK